MERRDPLDRLLGIFADVYMEVKNDVAATREDPLTELFNEVYGSFYRAETVERGWNRPVGFVDAGFKSYAFDVMSLSYIQVGGLIRTEDGELTPLRSFVKDAPVMDTYIIYVTRRRVSGREGPHYVFRAGIKTPDEETLLFGSRREVEEASRRVSETLSRLHLDVSYRNRKQFKKITEYLEGLLELAYAVKLYEYASREASVEYVCLDGTLLRWFSIRGRGIRADGLDILAAMLGVEPAEARGKLDRIVGLSKKTNLLSVMRARSVLRGRDTYANVNLIGAEKAAATLRWVVREGYKYGDEQLDKGMVDQITMVINRPVFPAHGVWVARFPLTMDGENVMVLDLYRPGFILDSRGELDRDLARKTVDDVRRVVNTLYAYREPLEGEPPMGFMKVDEIVRLRSGESRIIETLLLEAARRTGDRDAMSIAASLASTLRMRYGYRLT